MKRKATLVGGAAIIVLVVALGLWFGLHQRTEYVSIRDKITVDDGDTFHFENQLVSLPSGNSTNKVRLLGIDAPEEGQVRYKEAKELLESQIGLSERTVYMKIPGEPQDQLTWRRLLALVYLDKACEQSLNEMLIKEGMAIIYKPPKSLEDLQIVSDCLLDAQVRAAFGREERWNTDQQVVIAAIRYWGSPEQVVLSTEEIMSLLWRDGILSMRRLSTLTDLSWRLKYHHQKSVQDLWCVFRQKECGMMTGIPPAFTMTKEVWSILINIRGPVSA